MRDSRTRKRPITHTVHSHVRNRKRVRSYLRGDGTPEPKPEPKIIRELPKPRLMAYGGWKGSKYEATRELPLKKIAKMIKDEVQDKYKNIKVSVSTKHFSGGREVNVKITSYPNHFMKKRVIYPEMENLPEDKIPSYAWGWEYLADAKEILDGMKKIVNSYNFDDSDLQTDYFSSSFFEDVDFDFDLRQAEERRIGLIK